MKKEKKQEIMEKEKITRESLRQIELGGSKTFFAINPAEVESVRATAYQMGKLLECKFTVAAEYATRSVTVTRLPL